MKKLILLAVIAFSFVACTAEDTDAAPCGKIISKGYSYGKGTYIRLDTAPATPIYMATDNLELGDTYCK